MQVDDTLRKTKLVFAFEIIRLRHEAPWLFLSRGRGVAGPASLGPQPRGAAALVPGRFSSRAGAGGGFEP